jgi:hypothetical protein
MACQPCRMSDKSLQVNYVASNLVPTDGSLHSWEYEGRGVEQKTALNYSVMSGYYLHPTPALTTAQLTRLLEAALFRNMHRNTKHLVAHQNNSFYQFCTKFRSSSFQVSVWHTDGNTCCETAPIFNSGVVVWRLNAMKCKGISKLDRQTDTGRCGAEISYIDAYL